MKLFDNYTSKIRVKICGLANSEDIQSCSNAGVNALGFLLGESKNNMPSDKLTVDIAKELIAKVPSNVASVLLLKEDTYDELSRLINFITPSAIQLQSQSLAPEVVMNLKRTFPSIEIIKTIKILDNFSLHDTLTMSEPLLDYVDAILLDSAKGGSGKTHNWQISNKAFEYYKTKGLATILAGGLNTSNIISAIQSTMPDMVDLMSGVSILRGIKNIPEINKLMLLINKLNSQ